MRFIFFFSYLLVSCVAVSDSDKSKGIEEIYLSVEEINKNIRLMEILYDSSINSLERNESWHDINQNYSDSLRALFRILNDSITSVNYKAQKIQLDSLEYERIFSKIKLDQIQIKIEELRTAGYEYNL